MKTLEQFWHWADNEKPGNDLFEDKAVAKGPLSEEAQEALDKAAYVLNVRLPDDVTPSAHPLRPALKALSIAILQAWESLPKRDVPKLPNTPIWVPVSPNDTKQSLVRHPIKNPEIQPGSIRDIDKRIEACQRTTEKIISDRMTSVVQIVVGKRAKSIDERVELTINQETGLLLLHDGHNTALSYAMHYNHITKVEIKRACDSIADQRAAWKAKQVGP